MNKKEILRELEEALQNVGVTVKYETISGDGGYCKYKDKEFVILNKVLPVSSRVALLKGVLNELLQKKEDVFVKPVLREFLEEGKDA
ncbi:MAG: hypothetical protein AB7T10_01270 [bacterium]